MIIAHDPTTKQVVPFFPEKMNHWLELDSKRRHHWGWLNEMPYEGEVKRGPIVDGLYGMEGKIRGLALK